jgi:hypothetical protein
VKDLVSLLAFTIRRKMHEVHMLDKTYASLPVLLAAGLFASGASAPLSAGTSPSNTPQQEPTGQATQAGWYTQAQAHRGQVLYIRTAQNVIARTSPAQWVLRCLANDSSRNGRRSEIFTTLSTPPCQRSILELYPMHSS